MNYPTLYRLSGVAAIVGGLLRIASSSPLIEDETTLQWLYTGIDILLLMGIIGIYLQRAERLGFLGLTSFGVAVAALSFIGGPDADPFGFSTYEQGAAALAIALVGLSMAWVRAGEKPVWPALAWFASVVAVGLLGTIQPLAPFGMPAAGVLFGLGFVLAGLPLVGVSAGRAAR